MDDGFQREIGIGARGDLGQQPEPELGLAASDFGRVPASVKPQASQPGLATGMPSWSPLMPVHVTV